MRAPVPLEIALTDRFAIARNVATNGRLFCAMLAAINVTAGQHALAILAALPVGLAAIVDQLPAGKLRAFASLGVYGLAALVTLEALARLW